MSLLTAPQITTAKVVASIVGAVILVIVVLLGLGSIQRFIADPFHMKATALAQARQEAADEAAKRKEAEAQADLNRAGQGIVDAGRAKADVTVHIEQRNQNAIRSAPGAGQAIDPGLAGAVVRGLCRYDAYTGDPGCAGLQPDNPAQLPPTH